MLIAIGVILLLLLTAGLFACLEAAFLAARSGRLQQMADQGDERAASILQLRETEGQSLPALQAGFTLCCILSGLFGGVFLVPTLAELLLPWMPQFGLLATVLATLIVVGSITYVTLVLSVLVPRQLALQAPEAIVVGLARWLTLFVMLARPLTGLLRGSAHQVLRLLGRSTLPTTTITDEDIRDLVREGAQEGAVEQQEELLIAGVLRLDDRTARQIMTPRVDVEALQASQTIAEIMDWIIEIGYSRFPVYDENPDEIVGVVHIHDLLELQRNQGSDAMVREAMTPPTLVPENMRATRLLTIFRNTRRHMAIVVNDYGAIEGIVTLEDVLEEIVGDIQDEQDEGDPPQPVMEAKDGTLLMEGALPVDLLKEYLEVDELPDEQFYHYDTLAGLILSLAGRIPEPGDVVSWNVWEFTVEDMDGLRIDKVRVRKQEPAPDEAVSSEQVE